MEIGTGLPHVHGLAHEQAAAELDDHPPDSERDPYFPVKVWPGKKWMQGSKLATLVLGITPREV